MKKILSILASLIVAGVSQAQTTWHVDDDNCPSPGTGSVIDPFCSIQDGIVASVDGDTVLVEPGTYNQTINFIGKAITVRSFGGCAVTTIDGNGLNDSVVKCVTGEGPDTHIEGFTITGGIGHLFNATTRRGGGMYNEDASPKVIGCVFIDNVLTVASGNQGGGMFNLNSSPTVRSCQFKGNSVTDTGGGMNNSNSSSPLVTDCLFINNFALISGGGMYNNSGSSPALVSCMFISNTAISNGGGMHNGRSVDGASSLPSLTDCVLEGNTAGVRGGGMFNHGGSNANVVGCTLFSNSAGTGGGIYNSDILGSTNPFIGNSILWGNFDDSGSGVFAQIRGEAGSLATVRYSDVQGGWTEADGFGNIDCDPMFVDPDGTDNIPGNLDDDLRLLFDSPCIDRGRNDNVPPDVCDLDDDGDTTEPIPYDLDGSTRIVDGDGDSDDIVDMGAYEFQVATDCSVPLLPITIRVPNDFGAIQAAIDASCPGDEILVATGTYNETINFNGKAITLRSSDGSDVTIIDGCGLNNSVVKCVRGEGHDTVLDGFTIRGGTGSLNASFTMEAQGGGILNDQSNPTIKNCIIGWNNTVTPGDDGGGMVNYRSSPWIEDCTFIENTSWGYGGGMLNRDDSSPTVIRCKFIDNSSLHFAGGGMANHRNSNPLLINCLLHANAAVGNTIPDGGAIQNRESSNPTLINCTLSYNVANGHGGGMRDDDDCHPLVTNGIIWGNSDSTGSGTEGQISERLGSAATVQSSDIQGGWTGPGGDNIDADPMFVDSDGADDIPGNADDDLHLLSLSPCIDAGNNSIVSEATDLDGNPRIVGAIVDMGAYEFQIPVVVISIDVKPGSDPNSINLGSRGVIPVAILTTDSFDATTVNPDTVELAGSTVTIRGNGNRLLASFEDVDGDGDIDLVLQIETENLSLDGGATQATLTGETFDGQAISGSDTIVIVNQ